MWLARLPEQKLLELADAEGIPVVVEEGPPSEELGPLVLGIRSIRLVQREIVVQLLGEADATGIIRSEG